MRVRIVPEFEHSRVPLERCLDSGALHTASAAMNEPYFAQPSGRRRFDVFIDDGDDVGGSEGVEIQLGLDGNPDWTVTHGYRRHGATNVAVTTVLIPPRTEKSPTTVMRRGCNAAIKSSRIWFVTFS